MDKTSGRARGVLPLVVALLVFGSVPGSARAQSDYTVTDVSGGVTLTGRVVFRGEVPAPRRLLVTKDEEVCGFGYLERHEVTVSESGGLVGAVVYVDGIKQGKGWPDAEPRSVDQKDCVFRPNMLIAPRWADLNIVNSDPVLHNIHAWELMEARGRTLFNLGQPPEKEVITQALRPRLGNKIRLECDAHDFMQGWIFAADSPYAVATREDGSFVLDDLPPGDYTVKVWHPFLGVREQSVTVGAGSSEELEFDLTENGG